MDHLERFSGGRAIKAPLVRLTPKPPIPTRPKGTLQDGAKVQGSQKRVWSRSLSLPGKSPLCCASFLHYDHSQLETHGQATDWGRIHNTSSCLGKGALSISSEGMANYAEF
jgi:hypothetical protein